MTRFVLDASAVLTLLLGEPGADKVKNRLDGSMMTTVNFAEVVSHYARFGVAQHEIEMLLRALPIRLMPIDTLLSYDAGMLGSITLDGGLALGDRYCLALARREELPALTADQRWSAVAAAVGVSVEIID